MESNLQSISKIFTEKLFRIPDYQRGYAWTDKQLKDYWADIVQLSNDQNHYVGVLTLEDVPASIFESWEDDFWIIDSKSYTPYYVVDGQQRLTTSVILIQAIVESIKGTEELNYDSEAEIRKKYIFESKDQGISRSYIFGYEKDNPSYEYLKTKIFKEESISSGDAQETIYTHNLEHAKSFFLEKLKDLEHVQLEVIYKKITQKFLFNIYAISEEVDTYVAFETMNNRGKPLSHLELLKNRLIFLSTRFEDSDDEKKSLRNAINDAWKSIYHFLGKNKENPLDDDLFLLNHFILYFGGGISETENKYLNPRRLHRDFKSRYKDYLLEEVFSSKVILKPGESGTSKVLCIKDVHRYVRSLKSSVEVWYGVKNPKDSKTLKRLNIGLKRSIG